MSPLVSGHASTTYYLLITIYYSLFTIYYLLLTRLICHPWYLVMHRIYYLLLTTHYLLLTTTTYYLLLTRLICHHAYIMCMASSMHAWLNCDSTTYYLLLTTYYLLFTIYDSIAIARWWPARPSDLLQVMYKGIFVKSLRYLIDAIDAMPQHQHTLANRSHARKYEKWIQTQVGGGAWDGVG